MQPPLPPGSVCLFAAYAPTGNLPDYTRFYLKNLAQCGLALYVILSGANVITEETLNFCRTHNFHISKRPNGGLDFGAWSTLIRSGVADNAPYVLLANDSIFGPFSPLPPLLHHLKAAQRPAWGLVASRAVTPHLQSWFIGLSQAVWALPAIQRIFTQQFDQMSREEIIWHGELGLSVALRANHIPLHAMWSDHASLIGKHVPANPAHVYWRSFLRSGTVPFIKQELLRDNPYTIPDLSSWRKMLPQNTGFNPEWIEHYLATTPPRSAKPTTNRNGKLLYYTLSQLDRLSPLFFTHMQSGR